MLFIREVQLKLWLFESYGPVLIGELLKNFLVHLKSAMTVLGPACQVEDTYYVAMTRSDKRCMSGLEEGMIL